MPLDALFLNSLCAQRSEEAAGARIDKIHMPSRDEIILSLRTAADGNRRLLISAGGAPRVNFTSSHAENPPQPPLFACCEKASGGEQ
jgi:predicted ribosome quality control (RQC) complex YloA/Tae2 family protein